MKMGKVNNLEKWCGILEHMGFSDKDIPKIAEYANSHTLYQNQRNNSSDASSDGMVTNHLKEMDLAISLKVLKSIGDLSKIHFVTGPMFQIIRDGNIYNESVKTNKISVDLVNFQTHTYKILNGEYFQKIEELVITGITNQLMQLINSGNDIHMLMVVEDIAVVNSIHLNSSTVYVKSRYHVEPSQVLLDKTNSVTMDDL